jgi:hypothetical protein
MGPYDGGQAEFLRVPYGDFNCLVLPEDARDTNRQKDYVMLADIFPTGWHATRLAEMVSGDTVVIYGAGPVGLMATYAAMIQGASRVWVVDRHQDRLEVAERLGAIPIDYSKTSPIDRVMEDTGGIGADRGCECVGYQATDASGAEHPNITLNNLVRSVRFTGGIGVVGVFVPQDPGSPDPMYREGEIALDYGTLWFKGQRMGTGQCNVKAYNRKLLALIAEGKARRRSSCRTCCRSTPRRRGTSTSTAATRDGRRSSCTRTERADGAVRKRLRNQRVTAEDLAVPKWNLVGDFVESLGLAMASVMPSAPQRRPEPPTEPHRGLPRVLMYPHLDPAVPLAPSPGNPMGEGSEETALPAVDPVDVRTGQVHDAPDPLP